MVQSSRMNVTLPKFLKEAIWFVAEQRGCSQAEVVKLALYEHLKWFLEAENAEVKEK